MYIADRKYVQKGFEHDVIHMQLWVYCLNIQLDWLMFSGFHGKTWKCSNSAKFFVFSKFCMSIGFFRANMSQIWAQNSLPLTNIYVKTRLPLLYQTKMIICRELCYVDIAVVIATKWRRYLFELEDRSTELLPSTLTSMFVNLSQTCILAGWSLDNTDVRISH